MDKWCKRVIRNCGTNVFKGILYSVAFASWTHRILRICIHKEQNMMRCTNTFFSLSWQRKTSTKSPGQLREGYLFEALYQGKVAVSKKRGLGSNKYFETAQTRFDGMSESLKPCAISNADSHPKSTGHCLCEQHVKLQECWAAYHMSLRCAELGPVLFYVWIPKHFPSVTLVVMDAELTQLQWAFP